MSTADTPPTAAAGAPAAPSAPAPGAPAGQAASATTPAPTAPPRTTPAAPTLPNADGALSPFIIVSTDRDLSTSGGGLAFAVNGLPPAGTVVLQTLDPVLMSPAFLWVPVQIAGDIYQIHSYLTWGSANRFVLTGSAKNAPVTVAQLDPSNQFQIWRLAAANEGNMVFAMENEGANGAAVKRSVLHPVPGASLELGPPVEAGSHFKPYYYHFRAMSLPTPTA
jgi:hypothetical protein